MAYAEVRNDGGLFEKLVSTGRVSKTVKGGSLIGYVALSVAGDKNGRVGFGRGKARELTVAIQKSMEEARRRMVRVELKDSTLWYSVTAKHGASKVFMAPASEGTGIIAGGVMRAVLEGAGVRDVLTKCYGSTNPVNIVRATVLGLQSIQSPLQVAQRRGLAVEDVNV